MTELIYNISPDMRKPDFCICKSKDADQLRGNREADQRLCFRYTDSTIPLLSESEISSLLPYSGIAKPGLCQTSPGRKPRRPVFSQPGSYYSECHIFRSSHSSHSQKLTPLYRSSATKSIFTGQVSSVDSGTSPVLHT